MIPQPTFSRQRAQLSNLSKQLLKLHSKGKVIPKKLLSKFNYLYRKLLPSLGTATLKRILGAAAIFLLSNSIITAQTPNYSPATINPFGIDATTLSSAYYNQPAFADLDNDGDFDIICIVESSFDLTLHYFENTGSSTTPQFAPPVSNPFNFPQLSGVLRNTEFTDVDGDGDLDIVASGIILADNDIQGVFVIPNEGSVDTPSFGQLSGDIIDPFIPFDESSTFFFTLGDLDDDADIDLLSSVYDIQNDTLIPIYHENGSSDGSIILGPPSVNPFGLENSQFGLLNIFQDLADLDLDGDLDLLSTGISMVGQNYEATILYHENIGSAEDPQFASPISSPFNLPEYIIGGEYPRFKAVDLDGDNDQDIFILLNSQLLFFENSPISSTKEVAQLNFELSPNPTNGLIEINTEENLDRLELFNSLGAHLKTYIGAPNSIDLHNQPAGQYLLKVVTTDNKFRVFRVFKQ